MKTKGKKISVQLPRPLQCFKLEYIERRVVLINLGTIHNSPGEEYMTTERKGTSITLSRLKKAVLPPPKIGSKVIRLSDKTAQKGTGKADVINLGYYFHSGPEIHNLINEGTFIPCVQLTAEGMLRIGCEHVTREEAESIRKVVKRFIRAVEEQKEIKS